MRRTKDLLGDMFYNHFGVELKYQEMIYNSRQQDGDTPGDLGSSEK